MAQRWTKKDQALFAADEAVRCAEMALQTRSPNAVDEWIRRARLARDEAKRLMPRSKATRQAVQAVKTAEQGVEFVDWRH